MIIQPHWNRIVKKEWPTKARDYISMSDLGKPFVDRYYKMHNEPITNEFNERTLRIFEAGRVIEFIVLRALTMAGILNQKQSFVEIPANDNHLKVLGYLDATIGGFADFDKAKEIIQRHLQEYKLSLDDQLLEQKAVNIIDGLKEAYPNGIVEEMLVEVKSINSMAFWAHKNRDDADNFMGYDHNKMQLYGYMKATGIQKGILLYVSKDDFTLEEVGLVLGNEKMDELFNKDVETMTGYYKRGEVPPKEEIIIFDARKDAFDINWAVSRSQYLTKIYGYENSELVEATNHQRILDLNRAYKHLKEDKVKEEDKQYLDFIKKEVKNESNS